MTVVKTEFEQGQAVVFVGFLNESLVRSKIKSLGFSYISKMFSYSGPKNWVETLEMIRNLKNAKNLAAVIIQLTSNTILKCCENQYRNIWSQILNELKEVRTLLFIYEEDLLVQINKNDGLYEDQTKDEYYDRYFYYSTRQNVLSAGEKFTDVVSEVLASGIEVVPFVSRIDVYNRVIEFLDDIDEGVIIKLYLPNGKYQGEQLANLLRLFEDYIRNVEKTPFHIDQLKTGHGTIFVFKSKEILSADDLEVAIDRFNNFLEIVQSDNNFAREILKNLHVPLRDVDILLQKYSREHRRIMLDIKHEYEQKMLGLRQSFENEVLDYPTANMPSNNPNYDISGFLSLSNISGIVNVNLYENQTIVNKNTMTYLEEINNGDIKYGVEDKQLLELFAQHTDRIEEVFLKTALSIIKDDTIPKEKRISAWKRIEAFIIKILPILGEATVKALLDFLKQKYMP